IDYGNQGQVFEPFFTTKERQKRTGMGLATVYGFVKQAGGHIWFESEPGKGTLFTICFPLAVTEQEEPVGVPAGAETIMVVDDHVTSRDFTCAALRRLGYCVLEASNGPEAIKICEQTSEDIRLFVSDVMLPNMTGLDLASRL